MTWNLPPPPGFQGLRDDLPVHFYVRHLAHWRQDGATYFVTFRLADTLPQSKLRQLAEMRSGWEKELGIDNALSKGRFDRSILQQKHGQLSQQVVRQVEQWLDQGMGSCVLSHSEISRKICDALHYFDGDRYELGAYVVMPNHVHLLMRPLLPQSDSLETILQSRKRYTAQSINRFLDQSGTL